MIATADGDTPLSLSFIRSNKNTAQLLVNSLCKNLEDNPNALSTIESSLISLN